MRLSTKCTWWGFALLLFSGCGSLDDADLLGVDSSINLVIQNPDETARGTAKAVDGLAKNFAVSKAAATLGVTSCDIRCGSASKTISFSSGAAQVEASIDCPTGSNITVTATCVDSDKTTNSVQFGFAASATVNISGSDKITIDGRFLNQATRGSGNCRYARMAQDNNTQISADCGVSSALTDAQKTSFQCNIEFQTGNTATSPSTVDTSSDGLQATKGNPYILIDGGITAPSCFKYSTSDGKELKGTGSWVTDGDRNTKAVCKFGVRQWRQFDDDRNFRFAASCTRDGSTWALIPSSGMAEGKTSPAADSDVASLAANTSACSSANACSSGLCASSSLCAAVPAPTLAGSATSHTGCASGACTAGSTNGAASDAAFNGLSDSCFSPDGNTLYVIDAGNSVIRKIDLTLATTSSSFVTTFAGTSGSTGSTNGNCIGAALFNQPVYCVVNNANDTLFVTDGSNHDVRKITISPCSVSLLAGNSGTSGFTNATGSSATFNNPTGITIDSSGNLYVTDSNNNAIRKVTPGGVVTTLAGGCSGSNDGTGTNACFNNPRDVDVDSTDTFLYVTELTGERIRVVNTITQVVSTLATNVGGRGITIDPTDSFLYLTSDHSVVRVVIAQGSQSVSCGVKDSSGASNGTGTSASFSTPTGLVINPTGTTLYVTDTNNQKVRQVK